MQFLFASASVKHSDHCTENNVCYIYSVDKKRNSLCTCHATNAHSQITITYTVIKECLSSVNCCFITMYILHAIMWTVTCKTNSENS